MEDEEIKTLSYSLYFGENQFPIVVRRMAGTASRTLRFSPGRTHRQGRVSSVKWNRRAVSVVLNPTLMLGVMSGSGTSWPL